MSVAVEAGLHGIVTEKIIRILSAQLGEAEDMLDTVPDLGRVTGAVVSASFNGLDHPERQDALWEILDQQLSPEERRQVGPIVTLTPAEATINVSLDA